MRHRRLRRPLLVAMVAVAVLTNLVPSASAATIFSDGFENGLSAWSGATGFSVQQTTVRSGSWAGEASSTGSASFAWRSFSAQSELWSDTWFNVRTRSTAVWLVSYRKSGGGIILQVGLDGSGQMTAKDVVSKTVYRTTVPVTTGAWHQLGVHLKTGSGARFDVTLDGTAVPELSRTSGLGSTSAARFAVGDSNKKRTYRVAFDDVRVASDPGTADTESPSKPAGLTPAIIDSGSVDLSWQPATDDVGVTAYGVYRSLDGLSYGKVAETPGLTYRDRNLSPSTSYWWKVDAVDASGKRSELSDATTATTPSSDTAARLGAWSPPVDVGVVGVHAIVLHTGKVLLFYKTTTATKSAVLLDPATNSVEDVSPPVAYEFNMFCSGHVSSPNGEVFIVGGTGWNQPNAYGTEQTAFFDPLSETWRMGPSMSEARWYPTVATLPDGDSIIMAGNVQPGTRAETIERFDSSSETISTLPASAKKSMPYYPRLFLMPDGRFVRVGTERATMFFDADSSTWSSGPTMVYGQRQRGTAIHLPGLQRILAIGGTKSPDVETTASTEILDLNSANPQWRATDSMRHERRNLNAILLPDGKVLAVGGNSGTSLYDSPVLIPELYDPATERWTPMAPHEEPRAYHSSAALLPDGRVLTAGQTNGTAQTTMEIYSPPYLFAGPRPTIDQAPTTLAFGQPFTVATPDASAIDGVVLIRPSTVTHGVNFDQRSVELPFTVGAHGLEVTGPTAVEAPPGWYMLFLVQNGVPSIASWIQLG